LKEIDVENIIKGEDGFKNKELIKDI